MSYPVEWQPDVSVISDFLSDSQPMQKADAILVFGHYLPEVAMQAAQIFQRRIAPIILISGYYHDKVPAGFRSEAHHYAELMKQQGVPERAIILEEEASNTLENVTLGIGKLQAAGHRTDALMLVGVPWLMRRARATVAKQFPTIKIGTESFIPPEGMLDETRVNRLVGEVDRLIEYHAKGDLDCPVIPDDVMSATERLRASIEYRQAESKG